MKTITNRSIRFATLLSGAAIALPLWSAPALAQDSAADDAAADNAIIVTAQRRNERLEDVPMSVAVVTQETLAVAGVNTVRDLQNVTSGFQVGNAAPIRSRPSAASPRPMPAPTRTMSPSSSMGSIRPRRKCSTWTCPTSRTSRS